MRVNSSWIAQFDKLSYPTRTVQWIMEHCYYASLYLIVAMIYIAIRILRFFCPLVQSRRSFMTTIAHWRSVHSVVPITTTSSNNRLDGLLSQKMCGDAWTDEKKAVYIRLKSVHPCVAVHWLYNEMIASEAYESVSIGMNKANDSNWFRRMREAQ